MARSLRATFAVKDVLAALDGYLTVQEPSAEGELRGYCVLCEDPAESGSPSASYNPGAGVWNCLKTPEHGGPLADLFRELDKSVRPRGTARPRRRKAVPPPLDDEAKPREWCAQLLSGVRPRHLDFLTRERGLSRETIAEWRIGSDGRRITIPIEVGGRYVNVRRYLPHAPTGTPKIVSVPGHGSPSVLAFTSTVAGNASDVIVAAGELDAIFGWQESKGRLGWVTGTGGESTPPLDLSALARRNVFVLYDNDDAGRAGAQKFAVAARAAGATAHVLDIRALGVDKVGGDVTDWLLGGGKVEDLLAEMERARSGSAAPGRPSSYDDSPVAEFIAAGLAGQYVYIPGRGSGWLHNAGAVWERVSDEAARDMVRLQLKALHNSEFDAGVPAGMLVKLLSRTKAENIVALLKGILVSSWSDFDNHPDHLNTPTGVIDLRTAELLPHSDAFRFTAITEAVYDTAADATLWRKALTAWPPEVADYMQIVFGQAISGWPPDDDKVRFLKGGGENGKSTVLDGIRKVLGDFQGPVPDKVMVSRADEHPTEILELRGKRMATLEELPQGARVNTKRLKDVAGTHIMNARPLYERLAVWVATHSMFVTSNHHPLITETDHGTWRRLEMIVFPYTFVRGRPRKSADERQGDPALRHHFRTAADPAVLAWLVEGAQAWYAAGMRLPEPPPAVVAATEAWRALADDVLRFITETFESGAPDEFVLSDDVREHFDAWCLANNKQKWSNQTYADRFENHPALRELGVVKERRRVDKLKVTRPAFIGSGNARRATTGEPVPTGQLRVWRGLRWK